MQTMENFVVGDIIMHQPHKLCYSVYPIRRHLQYTVLYTTPRFAEETNITYRGTNYYHGFIPVINSDEVRFYIELQDARRDYGSTRFYEGLYDSNFCEFVYGLPTLNSASDTAEMLLKLDEGRHCEFLLEKNFGDLPSSCRFRHYGTILVERDLFEVWNGDDWLNIDLELIKRRSLN